MSYVVPLGIRSGGGGQRLRTRLFFVVVAVVSDVIMAGTLCVCVCGSKAAIFRLISFHAS